MRQIFVASTLALACAGAYAQSSVTLYGVVDLYAGVAKGGSVSQTRINDGGHIASQIGFRGSEDLGGGLKAVFDIQAGFSPDTGAGNIPATGAAAGSFGFTRMSWVGLDGGWGSVKLGRQYTPLFINHLRSDVFGVNSVFSPNILWAQIENLGTGAGTANTFQGWAARSENAIQYSSPTSNPIQGSLMYAPGEQAGNNSSGRYLSASLSYNAPGLYVGYGYSQKYNVAVNPNATAAHMLAAMYDAPSFRLGGSYGFQKADVTGAAKATIITLNGAYNISPASTVLLSVSRRDVSGGTAVANAADNTAITLGYNYSLSKRTNLYARYMRVANGGTSVVSLGQVTGMTAADNDVSLFGLGITHRF